MSRQNKLQLFILIFLTVSLLCHLNIHNAIFYNFYVWRTFRLCAVYTIYTVALMIVFRVSLNYLVEFNDSVIPSKSPVYKSKTL